MIGQVNRFDGELLAITQRYLTIDPQLFHHPLPLTLAMDQRPWIDWGIAPGEIDVLDSTMEDMP